MRSQFAHGYTYTAHPTCAAAGVANLNIVERERLADNAASTGCYLLSELKRAFADHPLVGEVRGRGLLAGVELVADRTRKLPFDPGAKVAARVAQRAAEEGVIIRAMPHSDTLGFAPIVILPRAVGVNVTADAGVAAGSSVAEPAILPLPAALHAHFTRPIFAP